MDEKEYEIELAKEKTKQERNESLFWLGFWFLIISGAIVYNIVMK